MKTATLKTMSPASAASAPEEGSPRRVTEKDVDIGRRIRMARKIAKLSQTELGQALGVTYQQVQKYENGTDRVAAARLDVIASVTDQPIAFFFGEDAEGQTSALPHKAEEIMPLIARLNDTGQDLAITLLRALAERRDLRR